ncbi:hypothetical protein KR044_007275, partial [Drosophila immigrans]
VDDLVCDQTRLLNMQTVLQHAAIASLTCTGPRTLGPDRKPLRLEVKHDVLTLLPVHAKVTRTEQTPAAELVDTSVFPDANIINASIVKRELAEECKRSVRLQLQAIKERQQSELNGQQAQQRQAEQLQLMAHSRVQRKENDKLLQQQAEQLAKSELEAQQREQQALLKRNNQKLLLLTIEGVSRCHSRFCSKYETVAQLLLTLDTESVQACAAINQELREVAQLFDQLVGKIKSDSTEALELNSIFTAEQYCQSLDKLEVKLHQQLTEQEQQQLIKAKQQAEEKEKQRLQQLEQQRQKKQEEQQQQEQKHQQELEALLKAAEATAKPQEADTATTGSAPVPVPGTAAVAAAATASATSGISSSYVHATRLAFYNEINALYQSKVDAVKPLQTDEAWKKYRTNCQRTINVPLNAITASSPQHLTTNFDKLYNFFAGQPVRTMDGSSITINDHPLARDYCILLMAKKFVSQTDTAISSNPQAAFPFASVINTFWKLLPDFGKIFLAYMYKESPYLVPYVIPQQPDQTPEQYLKTMGYRLSDSNELEKPDMFLKRQTGIARLYAAVIITPSRKVDGPTQCFGLEEAWRWLTHIMVVKPLPDICATMIMEMLQTLGFELWRAYGQNFLKLLVYIQTVYIPQLAAYDEGGPKTRLEMLLSKFLRERQIPQAVGVLPPGFW